MQGKNEQGMVHTAAAYAKQKNRKQIYACTTSIGPGALNMITAAAAATVNRILVLLLPGDNFATREPDKYGLDDLNDLINFGASPRASIYLTLAAKAHAFLQRRGYVTPEDVRSIGMDVLRHRIILSYEAEAEEIGTEDVIRKVLNRIEVP